MPFFDSSARPANGASAGGTARSLASRLWYADSPAGSVLQDGARAALTRIQGPVGRVESAGDLEDEGVGVALRRALAQPFAVFTRPRMEWYGCRGAFFHNDAHYDGVLFGVWTLCGPDRDLVFPRIDCRISATVGTIVVFDPFEPHGVLAVGESRYCARDYQDSEPNLFLGFEIALTPEVRAMFGIGPAYEDAPTLSSRVAINPETGGFTTAGA